LEGGWDEWGVDKDTGPCDIQRANEKQGVLEDLAGFEDKVKDEMGG